MDMLDMLKASGGLDAISSQLGIDQSSAAAGAEALLPAVLGGFKKHSQAGGTGEAGLGDLVGMLGGLGGGGLLSNVLGAEPTDTNRGNEVLGEIFGSKEVSRNVAGHAASQSGVDADTLKKMLPILAMLVGGYMSSQGGASQGSSSSGGGLLGSLAGAVLGGGRQQKGAGGLGGLGSLLDLDGDGNPLDDIIGMAGKFGR
jgi:hypothetical protein